MRHVDPTGHYFTLSSTFGGELALTEVLPTHARVASTVVAAPQTPLVTTARPPDVTLTEQGSYQYGYATPAPAPPDVTLSTSGSEQYAGALMIGIGGEPSASLQVNLGFAPPPPTLPPELAEAGTGTMSIYYNAYADAESGHFSLRDALAVGFVTGGWIATFLGVPEVGIPVVIATGTAYETT